MRRCVATFEGRWVDDRWTMIDGRCSGAADQRAIGADAGDAELGEEPQVFGQLLTRLTHRPSPLSSSAHRSSLAICRIGPSHTRTRATSASARRDRGSATPARVFELQRLLDFAVGGDEHGGVGLGVEAGAGARDVVGDDQVDVLGGELLARARARVAGLGGEADEQRAWRGRRGRVPSSARMSGVRTNVRVSGPSVLAILRRRGPVCGRVVGDGGRHDDRVGARGVLRHRARHLARAADAFDLHAGGRRRASSAR